VGYFNIRVRADARGKLMREGLRSKVDRSRNLKHVDASTPLAFIEPTDIVGLTPLMT
jgi:hypothetical protein